MIGRVYRGGNVAGLLRYLYGPGRHNEHKNPHLVAAWDLQTPAELATFEPLTMAGSGVTDWPWRDFGPMVAGMEWATALRPESVTSTMVWHTPLRTAPGDRPLSDAEWGDIARDLMHRTGIARRDDPGGCRWIAVRHDDVSIHVVAVLARQDGREARTPNDWLRVREACRAAEQKYGLALTAPADRTAARHTTRAEVERAVRTGHELPARDWLRAQVQHAAAASTRPKEFLDRLRAGGVAVRERLDEGGHLRGYAVARREPGRPLIWFGGGKLATDLSLPRLQARWQADATTGTGATVQATPTGPDRRAVWAWATQAASEAAELVRQEAASNPDVAGDAAAAATDVLAAAGRLIEGQDGGWLTRAARDYDRAARETFGRTAPHSQAGAALRTAALALVRASSQTPRRREAAHVALLVAQIAALSHSIAHLREVQGRTAQAAAARRAAAHLDIATDHWSERAEAALTADPAPVNQDRATQPGPATATSSGTSSSTARTVPAGRAATGPRPRPPTPLPATADPRRRGGRR